MRKTIGLLSILLAAQLLLAVGMSFTGPDLAAVRPDTPLLAATPLKLATQLRKFWSACAATGTAAANAAASASFAMDAPKTLL